MRMPSGLTLASSNQRLTMCMQSGLAFTQAMIEHIFHPLIKLGVSNTRAIMANTQTHNQRLTTCMRSRLAFVQAAVEHVSHLLI